MPPVIRSIIALFAVLAGSMLSSAQAQDEQRAPNPSAPRHSFDAEYHIGLVANDAREAVAAANTARLNAALEATTAHGSFDFARGPRGPVLLPIVFAAKTFYFKGELKSAVRVGSGALLGGGGAGYPLGDADLGPRGLGGATTRFVRIDPVEGGAVLRLRGAGLTLRNIELFGRRLGTNLHAGSGLRSTYGIAMEGRNYPATGKHNIADVAIVDCEQAIAFLPGNANDAGELVKDEAHADESMWGRITVFNCGRAVVSTNQQASWHHFQHLKVLGGADPTDVILDVERGGTWRIDMLMVGVSNVTVLRVKDFSQNMSRFDIASLYRDHFTLEEKPIQAVSSGSPIEITCPNHGFRTGRMVRIGGVEGNAAANGTWKITVPAGSTDTFLLDGSTASGAYTRGGKATLAQRITLFEFAGKNPQPWMRWSVRINGHFSEMPVPDLGYGAAGEPTFAGGFRFPTSELVKLNGLSLDPSGRYGASILLDINNMPSWVSAKYWPHGAYRLTVAERDLIANPYPGLSVWVLDAPATAAGRQARAMQTGHHETWDGQKWSRPNSRQ
jgi:hypothetical protein